MAKTKSAYATAFAAVKTPQTEAVPGREAEMKKNNAGGMTFTVTPFQMLERFLILGSDQPTYYSSAQKLTKENSANIRECLRLDWRKTIDTIVDVSVTGRAPKNDPALFALAVAASPNLGSADAAQYALANLSKVARIGTHLFHFAEYLDSMRGWGRSVKTAVGNWYTDRTQDSLAYQLAKYQQRDGWSTKDMVHLSHVKTDDAVKNALIAWAAVGGSIDELKVQAETWTRTPKADKYVLTDAEIAQRRGRFQAAYDILTGDNAPKLITAFEKAKTATKVSEIVKLITDGGLTHEMIPTQFKTSPEVWDALLQKMPLGAMVRNLGVMSKVGLLKPLSAASKIVVNRLHDQAYVLKSRLHPLNVMLAQGTYATGKAMRGDSTWTVVPTIVDALEDTFYLAFGNVVPTGKNVYIGLDTSGSMTWPSSMIKGTNITSAQAGAAMMLLFARTEHNYANYAFSTGMREIGVTAKDTLKTAMDKAQRVSGGGTNCAAPMEHAEKAKMEVDAFIVITDNESWYGGQHAFQALRSYRKSSGIQDARLIAVSMVANSSTIADPKDPYMLDVVGFDTNVPMLVTDFIRGKAAKTADEDVDE